MIILLIAFITSQYAGHLSYFECKLANYFRADTENCNCEQVIRQEDSSAEQSPAPVAHNHIHIDESYCPPVKTEPGTHPADIRIIYLSAHTSLLASGVYGNTDHPPQFG